MFKNSLMRSGWLSGAVKVPARNMIGKENEGFIWAMTIIGYNRNFVPLACLGAAQKSLEETIGYLKQRQIMGKSATKWQGVANELATEATDIGFAGVLSGPLVRSSYRAGRLYRQAMDRRAAADR